MARAALSARRRVEHEREAAVARQTAAESKATKQLEQARQGHEGAAARLKERQAILSQQKAKLDAQREAAKAKRAAAVAALQVSTAAAHQEIKSKAAGRAPRLAAKEAKVQADIEAYKEFGRLEAVPSYGRPQTPTELPGYNPYLEKRKADEAARSAREKRELDQRMAARMQSVKAQLATKLEREKALKERARLEKANERPLPHVNPEMSGPRTVTEPSVIELG